MNLGNLLQVLALLALCIFTHSEYQNRQTLLESNIQALRVQKSFSGRQKIIFILVLGCISAFHFIRYFYIDFEEEETYLREHYKLTG